MLEQVRRGDIGGMSFSFVPTAEAWIGTEHRELRGVDLLEVSVVQSFPAYADTSVHARSRAAATAYARTVLRRALAGTW